MLFGVWLWNTAIKSETSWNDLIPPPGFLFTLDFCNERGHFVMEGGIWESGCFSGKLVTVGIDLLGN